MIKKTIIILTFITTIIIACFFDYNPWFKVFLLIAILLLCYIAYNLLFFLGAFLISLTIDRKKEYEKSNNFYNGILQLTLEFLTDMARVKLTVTGLDKVPNNEKFMLVSNHKSRFDPMIQSHVFRKNKMVYISKPENFKILIAGVFMKRCCYLSIDRENPRNALVVINQAAKFISSQQFCVGINPEGTRNFNDGLLPFRNGCFKIALKAKCPIVVCTMRNTFDIHKNFPWKKTLVEMHIVKVISYNEIASMNTTEISQIIRQLMLDDLNIIE